MTISGPSDGSIFRLDDESTTVKITPGRYLNAKAYECVIQQGSVVWKAGGQYPICELRGKELQRFKPGAADVRVRVQYHGAWLKPATMKIAFAGDARQADLIAEEGARAVGIKDGAKTRKWDSAYEYESDHQPPKDHSLHCPGQGGNTGKVAIHDGTITFDAFWLDGTEKTPLHLSAPLLVDGTGGKIDVTVPSPPLQDPGDAGTPPSTVTKLHLTGSFHYTNDSTLKAPKGKLSGRVGSVRVKLVGGSPANGCGMGLRATEPIHY